MDIWGKTASEFGLSIFLLFIILTAFGVAAKLVIKAISAYLNAQNDREVETKLREKERELFMRDLLIKLIDTVNKNADAYQHLTKAVDNQSDMMSAQIKLWESWK